MTDGITEAKQNDLGAMSDTELFDLARKRALSAERYASRTADVMDEAASRIDARASEGRQCEPAELALIVKASAHDFRAAEYAMKGSHARATVAGCKALGVGMTAVGDR